MPSSDPVILVYISVGLVVESCQLFEATFVLAAKLALKQSDVETIEDVIDVSMRTSCKQPTMSILKELSVSGRIDGHLERRMSKLIENRHRVIHREYLESRWPSHDPAWCVAFCKLCQEICSESLDLMDELLTLLAQWFQRFPSTQDIAAKHLDAIQQLKARAIRHRCTPQIL